MNSITKSILATLLVATAGQIVALPSTETAGKFFKFAAGYAAVPFNPILNHPYISGAVAVTAGAGIYARNEIAAQAQSAGKHVVAHKKIYGGALAAGLTAAAGFYGYNYGMPGFISTGAHALVDYRVVNFIADNRVSNAVASSTKAVAGFAVDNRATNVLVSTTQSVARSVFDKAGAIPSHVWNHKVKYALGSSAAAGSGAVYNYGVPFTGSKKVDLAPEVKPASLNRIVTVTSFAGKTKVELEQMLRKASPSEVVKIQQALKGVQ